MEDFRWLMFPCLPLTDTNIGLDEEVIEHTKFSVHAALKNDSIKGSTGRVAERGHRSVHSALWRDNR